MPKPSEAVFEAFENAGAMQLAAVNGPDDSKLYFYSLSNGRLRIIHLHQDFRGSIEIYKPVTESISVADAIDAALK